MGLRHLAGSLLAYGSSGTHLSGPPEPRLVGGAGTCVGRGEAACKRPRRPLCPALFFLPRIRIVPHPHFPTLPALRTPPVGGRGRADRAQAPAPLRAGHGRAERRAPRPPQILSGQVRPEQAQQRGRLHRAFCTAMLDAGLWDRRTGWGQPGVQDFLWEKVPGQCGIRSHLGGQTPLGPYAAWVSG